MSDVIEEVSVFCASLRGHPHEREILHRTRVMAACELKRRSYPWWRRGRRSEMAAIIDEHRRVVNEELIPSR